MGLKEEATFARNLTIGAHGAYAVAEDLKRWGHQIIELERYAMANKVWKIRVKRLRIPDLLCVNCGRRFESKGKSKLEIKLSHSAAQGREWHAGGMRDSDVYAFLRVELAHHGPVSFRPLYITRQALQETIGMARKGRRKAASEGSEVDLQWPLWVPSYSGTLVGQAPDGAIHVYKEDGKRRSYPQGRAWPATYLYLDPGGRFDANRTAVAGPARPAEVRCPGATWNLSQDLFSSDPNSRYAAVKAARFRASDGPTDSLKKVACTDQDWRVRLEALGACANHYPHQYVAELTQRATHDAPLEEQVEVVFILTELDAPEAIDGLTEIALDDDRESEVRAAAAWGLGVNPGVAVRPLLRLLDDNDDRVALHAASAFPPKLPPDVLEVLLSWCRHGTSRQCPMAATLLARKGHIKELYQVAREGVGDARLYAARALGDLPPEAVWKAIGPELDPELLSLLEVVWIEQRDWLRSGENSDAMDILATQRLKA